MAWFVQQRSKVTKTRERVTKVMKKVRLQFGGVASVGAQVAQLEHILIQCRMHDDLLLLLQ